MLRSCIVKGCFLAILAGIILLFFGLYPQLRLWRERGENWQGAYAYNDLDEMAYAAYLQSLVDGRPRRSDPYTGRDESPATPQAESLFSIQFLPPLLLATTARIFGASASTMMVLAAPIAAFFAALAMFWLIAAITRDSLFAFSATLVVLCCGVLINGEGAVGAIINDAVGYPYFPFLRRYVPAIPFPVFFFFCLSIWNLLIEHKRRVLWFVIAVGCFAFLVYSYFYFWTTAFAFLICLIAAIFFFKPDDWQRILKTYLTLCFFLILTLIPYFFLLTNRAASTDHVQLLVYTRLPDFSRPPLILSLFVLSLLAFAVWRRYLTAQNPKFIFAFGLALVSIAAFNQQIVTGRSLQPIHYQIFIVNYVSLASFMLAASFLWQARMVRFRLMFRGLLPLVAVLATCWGFAECYYNTWFLDEANVVRDQAFPVAKRLTNLAETELFDENGERRITLNLNLLQGNDQPTLAPQAVLWARHLHVFSGASWEENKERLYQFYYYAGVDAAELEKQLRERNIVTIISFFGWGRHASRLTKNYKPLTPEEIRSEAQNYARFCADYDRGNAARHKLSYVVVDVGDKFDLSNLDQWYERDAGELLGNFMLYRVRLRKD